jgi:hypothetical protein
MVASSLTGYGIRLISRIPVRVVVADGSMKEIRDAAANP